MDLANIPRHTRHTYLGTVGWLHTRPEPPSNRRCTQVGRRPVVSNSSAQRSTLRLSMQIQLVAFVSCFVTSILFRYSGGRTTPEAPNRPTQVFARASIQPILNISPRRDVPISSRPFPFRHTLAGHVQPIGISSGWRSADFLRRRVVELRVEIGTVGDCQQWQGRLKLRAES
jgi:hypothetical protein